MMLGPRFGNSYVCLFECVQCFIKGFFYNKAYLEYQDTEVIILRLFYAQVTYRVGHGQLKSLKRKNCQALSVRPNLIAKLMSKHHIDAKKKEAIFKECNFEWPDTSEAVS